jgi:hypothetical protein
MTPHAFRVTKLFCIYRFTAAIYHYFVTLVAVVVVVVVVVVVAAAAVAGTILNLNSKFISVKSNGLTLRRTLFEKLIAAK